MKVKIFFSFSLLFFCCSKQIEEPVDVVNKAVESIVNMNYDELLELYDSSSQNIIKSRIETLSTKNKTTNSNLILKKGGSLGLMDFILNRNYSKTMLTKKTSVLALVKKK